MDSSWGKHSIPESAVYVSSPPELHSAAQLTQTRHRPHGRLLSHTAGLGTKAVRRSLYAGALPVGGWPGGFCSQWEEPAGPAAPGARSRLKEPPSPP